VLSCVQKLKQLHSFGRDSDVESATDESHERTYVPDSDSDLSVIDSGEMSIVLGNKTVAKLTFWESVTKL